jgi:hypothetical protein
MKSITQSDHDLLIELRTEVQNIRNDIKDLKDGTTMRIKYLEENKADKKDVDALLKKVNDDLDTRVRVLEESKGNYFTAMIIYTAVGVTMISLILYHIFQ